MRKKIKCFFVVNYFAVCIILLCSLFSRNVKALPDGAKEVNPIAKYEFSDSTNPGKDTMGNYDLVVKKVNEDNGGQVTTLNGAAVFDGSAALISTNEKDISEDLSSFCLGFDIKKGANSDWAMPIGFGFNDWNPTMWMTFEFSGGSDLLRFGANRIDGSSNAFWLPEIATVSTTEYHRVILSAKLGGKINVYLDGVAKYSYDMPADYSLKDVQARFAIGGGSCWGNVYSPFFGEIKNVNIYDFAFEDKQVKAYQENGLLTSNDVDEIAVSANVDYTNKVIVDSKDTDEEILHYAPKNDTIEVELFSGVTKTANVSWNEVTTIDGEKYLSGELSGVGNPNGIKALAKIGVVSDSKELMPVAKYEFLESENPGKDSMGNYNLVVANADNDNPGTIACKDGVATFNGTAALMSGSEDNDISEKLKSLTLTFDVKVGSNGSWAEPIGFGWNDWNPTKWAAFMFSGNSTLLRFTCASSLDGNTGLSNVDGNGNQFWGKEIGEVNDGTSKVILTLEQGGKIRVYFDGNCKYEYNIPEDFDLKNNLMQFGIGANCTWGAGRNFFNGEISNVSIYDFAMTEQQVTVFGYTNKVKTNTLLGSKYIAQISDDVSFTGDKQFSEIVYTDTEVADMLTKLNSATTKLQLSDDTTVDANVTWVGIKETDGNYYAQGTVNPYFIDLPTACGTKSVSVLLDVEVRTFNITSSTDGNGTIKLSSVEPKQGDIVTITVSPKEGYELEAITVDGQAIEAKDGVYSFTASKDVEVNATFKKIESQDNPTDEPAEGGSQGSTQTPTDEPEEEGKSSKGCGGEISSIYSILVVLVALVCILFKRGKKVLNK